MSGGVWMLVDLLAPVILLVVLIGLIATAEADPARALHCDPQPDKVHRRSRRRNRSRDCGAD